MSVAVEISLLHWELWPYAVGDFKTTGMRAYRWLCFDVTINRLR